MGMFSKPCGDEKQYKMSAEGQSSGVSQLVFSSHGPTPSLGDVSQGSHLCLFAHLLRQG